ncbi:MAG: hypothetical protein AAGJ18_24375 [Bacteroidota bacterium]
MKHLLFLLPLLFISAMCSVEPMPEPVADNDRIIGIWRILPEDRREDYHLEIVDFRPDSTFTFDVDRPPYDTFDAKKQIWYKIDDWEGRERIFVRFLNTYYPWMFFEFENDLMIFTHHNLEGEIRYRRIK